MKLKLIIGFFAVLILSACGLSEQDDTAPINTALPETKNAQPTLTLSNTPEPTATETITPIPTATLSPTSTFTPLPTSTTKAFVSVIAENALVYSGPGAAYDLLAIYTENIKVYAVGRHENNAWVIILLPDKQGWVAADKVVAEFDIDTLPMFEIPSTHLPSSTLTPFPDVSFLTSNEEYGKEERSLSIFIRNVIPYEPLKIDIYSPDGEHRTSKSVTANPKGNYNAELLKYRIWVNLPHGTYEVIITGEYGSKITGSFTLPLDK